MPPGITSPLGSKTYTATSSQRMVEIPDESEHSYPPQEVPPGYVIPERSASPYQQPQAYQQMHVSPAEAEAQIREARRQKVSGESRITPGAKQRIEYLANIGRLNRDVVVDGATFTIRTLKNKEMRDSFLAAAAVEAYDQMFEARRQQLARAMVAIDGKDIGLILGDESIEAKLNLIDEMDQNLITHLYSQFSLLNKEGDEKFSIKTDVEMKEVVEDIKK